MNMDLEKQMVCAQPLDASAQRQMFAFDLLRVALPTV
jgi:hypothetical protein